MTANKKANEIYMEFYLILFDSDSDKGEEVQVSTLAKKCALACIDKIISSGSHTYPFLERVKEEIELID